MAKVFLDSNYIIETVGLRQSAHRSQKLGYHILYLSPLSIHILCYVFKVKIPSSTLEKLLTQIHPVPLTGRVLEAALKGPTDDLEDNLQLCSATEADCEYFLTNDQALLKMGVFGKTKIVNGLPQSK
ncbi:hypothetical protein A2188_01430 [Candidatus Woesebacteria bacterium RIFOXYA1_FULL_43_9]|uniref:PIN domain-containing protein n=1 Tax=Candidatus Woesebacteria bacterium RIFOXYA1_FULL_43_9 TaxID=1802534 RepID=A0A1F8CLE2_9BACT|nr:MAG: hypothetical protein A2188_01430 [Candidatus Woesebacteria bacterium RIFOXYA1_FULL_43_9]